MKICVVQREGVRYFTKFQDLGERDKLEIEVQIDSDNSEKVLNIDLTPALLDEYAKHQEIGRIDPEAQAKMPQRGVLPLVIKQSMTVSPAYLTESKQQKDEFVAKVRVAQVKLSEEKKQKAYERAKAMRKAKAEKQAAEAKRVAKNKPEKTATAASKKTTKTAKASDISVEAKKTRTNAKGKRVEDVGLSKEQKSAIAKISATMAKEDSAKAAAKVKAMTARTTKVKTETVSKASSKTDAIKTTAGKTSAKAADAPVAEVKKPTRAKVSKSIATTAAKPKTAAKKTLAPAKASAPKKIAATQKPSASSKLAAKAR